MLLALQALLRALTLGSHNHPEVHPLVIRYGLAVEALPEEAAAPLSPADPPVSAHNLSHFGVQRQNESWTSWLVVFSFFSFRLLGRELTSGTSHVS